jgi:hypothetical protein
MQPNPFREFAGAKRILLPLIADELATSLAQIYAPAAAARVQDVESMSLRH